MVVVQAGVQLLGKVMKVGHLQAHLLVAEAVVAEALLVQLLILFLGAH
jgi:hypothetical protein